MRIVIGVLTAWLVSSCTFFGNEERLGRLEEGSTQKIEIPEGLDRPQFIDLMPIPEIEDPRGLLVPNLSFGRLSRSAHVTGWIRLSSSD